MSLTASDPFRGPVTEVALPSAPLAKVLAQLRYPRPLDFDDSKSVEPVRRALAGRYPVGRETKANSIIIGPAGVSQQATSETNWILEDLDSSWRVTIADKFITIETNSYTSRDDFTSRLGEIIDILAETIKPPIYDRLGIRYINRLEGHDILQELPQLVQPVALAGLAVPHEGIEVQHSLCDNIFIDGNAHLQARWGWLPQGAMIDPTIPPPAVPYWTLDLDSFTGKGGPFEVIQLKESMQDLAERAHRFFRWIVTDEFLKRFGGQP